MGKRKKNNHKIIILTGMSGSGKDTILNKLCNNHNHYKRIVTYTTRPPRDNETNGKDYNFVTYSEFMNMIHNDNIIEHRVYHTVYGDWYYGSSDLNIDLTKRDYCIILTLDGVDAFKKRFGAENCIVFYIDVPNHIRKKRVKNRPNFDESEWQRRLMADKEDFSFEKVVHTCDFKIANYDKSLDDVITNIKDIIKYWKS